MSSKIFLGGNSINMDKEIKETEKDLRSDEIGFTYVHKAKSLSMFGLKDFLTQVKMFKNAGIKYIDGNQYEKEINSKQYIMIVFSPKNNSEDFMCPLAMQLGVIVCGFTYLLKKDKISNKLLEEIKRMLKK
jgi:hypothetical protein